VPHSETPVGHVTYVDRVYEAGADVEVIEDEVVVDVVVVVEVDLETDVLLDNVVEAEVVVVDEVVVVVVPLDACTIASTIPAQ